MKSALFCLTGSLLFTLVMNLRAAAQNPTLVPPEITNYLTETQNSPPEPPDFAGHKTQWVAGGRLTTIATSEDTGGQYSLFDIYVPPDVGSPVHFHTRENEGFYVVDGDVSIQMENEVINATPGTYVYSPKDHIHSFRNLSTTPARMILLYTPSGIENFFNAVGQRPTDPFNAPSFKPEDIITASNKYGLYSPSTLVFSAPQYSVNEDGTSAAVTVLRTGESKGGAGATIALSDGTAIPINFAAGEITQTVNTPVPKGDNTINLTLEDPTGDAGIGLLQDKAVLTVTPVPEPSSALGVLTFGALGASLMLKRKQKLVSRVRQSIDQSNPKFSGIVGAKN